MGPDTKDKLRAPDEEERRRQELDQLILASKRLVEEMQALTSRARELTKQQVDFLRTIKRRN